MSNCTKVVGYVPPALRMKFGGDTVCTTCAPRLAKVTPYRLQYSQEPPLVSFSTVLRTLLRSVRAAPKPTDLNTSPSACQVPPSVRPVTLSLTSVPESPM